MEACVGVPLRLALTVGLFLLAPGVATAQQIAPVDDFPDVLDQYRRFEVPVPVGFTATCAQQALIATCTIAASELPEGFNRLLRTFKGGVIEGVDLLGRRKGGFDVRLTLRAAPVGEVTAVRTARLENPSRWVIEAGYARFLSDPIEEEVAFRPYPVKPGRFEPAAPSPSLAEVEGESEAHEKVNACIRRAVGPKPAEGLADCEAALQAAPRGPLQVAAKMALGEVMGALGAQGRAPDLSAMVEALNEAERVAPTMEAKARFALLQSRGYEPMGYPARAEVVLGEKLANFKGSDAEPWVLAGQLRSAIDQRNDATAKALLERLKAMPGTNVNIGGAVLLAGGQAYQRQEWLKALEVLEAAARQWPDLVRSRPEALFHLGELCVYFGRYADAVVYYEAFLRQFGDVHPQSIVRVRLASLSTRSDPLAGRARLLDLAASLTNTEAQQLAALQAVRMSNDDKERRRILRQIERTDPTAYIAPEFFVERARVYLAGGLLRPAYEGVREVWRKFPQDALLKRSPQLADRLLALLTHNYVQQDRPLAALSTYYSERARFEAHPQRPWMHLLAGRAMARFGLTEEAASVWQRGLKADEAAIEPDVEGALLVELASALARLGDTFKLSEVLTLLDKKYPDRFDTLPYWRAKAADARARGRLNEARDMLVFALNGPVTGEDRVALSGEVAALYGETGQVEREDRALRTQLELMDAQLDAAARKASATRRALRWQLAELSMMRDAPADVVRDLSDFMAEYPDDARLNEANFQKARALDTLGDRVTAVRIYDALVNDPKPSDYKRLAKLELELLRWNRRESPRVLEEAGFSPPPAL